MRLNKTFILLVATMLSLPAAADDFGLWPEVSIEKKLGRFSVEASAGMRFDDAVSRLTRTDLGVGVDYKLLKFLKLGVGYDFIRDYTGPEEEVHYNSSKGMNGYDVKQSYWRTKHRFHFDATGKYRVGRFTFSLRERYQLTRNMAVTVTENKYRGIVSDPATYEGATYQGSFNDNVYAYRESKTKERDAKTKHFLRSRLGVSYNIARCPITPFASFEISNNLANGFSLDKRRWILGADWKVARQHSVSLAYVFTNGDDGDNDANSFAINVGYTFSF